MAEKHSRDKANNRCLNRKKCTTVNFLQTLTDC